MSDPRHELGRRAEEIVADWLGQHGWRILARRQRSLYGGEVDIVALDPDATLVAIEVRARGSGRLGPASASLARDRVPRLRRTLASFAAAHRAAVNGMRIDLVTVERIGARQWRLHRHAGIGDWSVSRRRGTRGLGSRRCRGD